MTEKIVALKMWEKTLVKARILLTKWKNGGYWFTWSNVYNKHITAGNLTLRAPPSNEPHNGEILQHNEPANNSAWKESKISLL